MRTKKKKIVVDWCDHRWAALIPYDHPPTTHFLSHRRHVYSRSGAITQTVLDWCGDHGEVSPVKRDAVNSGLDLERNHADWRRRTWRRLYRKGFRVVRVKTRQA